MENKTKKFKFNIIDALVIVVILAVIAFFALKFIDFEQATPSTGTQKIEFVVQIDAMSKEMYEEIAPQLPAQMISNGKYIEGYIQSCESEPCNISDIEVCDWQNQTRVYHMEPEGEYVTVRFYCQAQMETDSLLNTVGSQEVRVGRTHYVKSNDFEVVGTVISVERSAE